jgi:hypothetical protein
VEIEIEKKQFVLMKVKAKVTQPRIYGELTATISGDFSAAEVGFSTMPKIGMDIHHTILVGALPFASSWLEEQVRSKMAKCLTKHLVLPKTKAVRLVKQPTAAAGVSDSDYQKAVTAAAAATRVYY